MVALLSQDIAFDFEKATGIKAIPLPKYEKLDVPVSSHADMLVCVIEDYIFFYEDYYNKNEELFKKIDGYKIVLVQKECKIQYPNDIGLNVLIVGKKIFCSKKNTASEIISFAEQHGYEIVDVKQGYSACSTMVLDANHVITGDKGMYKALTNSDVETLLIDPQEIRLDGYNHGFIGGSVGVLDKTAYFFGEVKALSDEEKIKKFLKKLEIEEKNILQNQLFDFGGIKFLNCGVR